MSKSDVTKPIETTFSFEKCHEGNVLVYYTDHAEFYGGGSSRGCKKSEVDLVVDLAVSAIPTTRPVKYNGGSKVLKQFADKSDKYANAHQSLSIDWPDLGVPSVSPHLFIDLVDLLNAEAEEFFEENERKMKILICCAGGHGRTGTALVIVGILLGAIPSDKTCITALRNIYCDHAVESVAQAAFIDKFAGCVVDFETPKKGGQSGYYTGYSTNAKGTVNSSKDDDVSDEDYWHGGLY